MAKEKEEAVEASEEENTEQAEQAQAEEAQAEEAQAEAPAAAPEAAPAAPPQAWQADCRPYPGPPATDHRGRANRHRPRPTWRAGPVHMCP